MTSEHKLVDTSKFLSYVLRHAPESIGIALDTEGWVAIDSLIAAAKKANKALDHALIADVVASSDKKRFTLSEDGLLIRAAQGHSTQSVSISYQPKLPPAFLYHGTATRFLDAILANGLAPQSRQHVHLSHDISTATSVGVRHGKPVILKIEANTMYSRGYSFYQADNGVWLTESVPSEFLQRVDEEA